jgi:hypothetical protein
VRAALAECGEHVLFLVDDTIFCRAWSAEKCAKILSAIDVIGVSLRLGMNTHECYPLGRSQRVPRLVEINPFLARRLNGMNAWRWPGADGDFGYPLEVSSSVYRTRDVLAMLRDGFCNPNELELELANRAESADYRKSHPWLASYATSVAFSNPCNRVQSQFQNRAGSQLGYSAARMLELWEQGYRIDIYAFVGYVPRAAHEEAPLRFVRQS